MSHKRICHVYTFAELEDLMQNLLNDRTIYIEEGYPVLSMYSKDLDKCYDEDEILDCVGTYLGRNLSWTSLFYDSKEVYFIESSEIEDTLPRLVRWVWEDCVTISAYFGNHIDENGEEYDLHARYQTEDKVWDFVKVYEDYNFRIYHEDYKKSMKQQMETILKKENVL